MHDYLIAFEKYRYIKEIAEIIDDVNELRNLYNSQQYDAMKHHIIHLTKKYPMDTILWNSTHPSQPLSEQQWYINAEVFMRLEGVSTLMKHGIKPQEQLTSEEAAFIESTIKQNG